MAEASETDLHVGQRLAQAREAAGLSLAQLGEAVGLSGEQVRKYECAKDCISVSRLIEIADTLSRAPDWFLPQHLVRSEAVAAEESAYEGYDLKREIMAVCRDLPDDAARRKVLCFAEDLRTPDAS